MVSPADSGVSAGAEVVVVSNTTVGVAGVVSSESSAWVFNRTGGLACLLADATSDKAVATRCALAFCAADSVPKDAAAVGVAAPMSGSPVSGAFAAIKDAAASIDPS